MAATFQTASRVVALFAGPLSASDGFSVRVQAMDLAREFGEDAVRMKAYCINLDRRPDRLAHIAAELKKVGIPFERIPAVDGSDPAVAAAAARLPVSFRGARISTGAYGATQSHRAAWQRLIDSGGRWAMVFEDDVMLTGHLADCLSEGWLPRDADIVKLETFGVRVHLATRGRHPAPGDRKLARLLSCHIGAAAYILNRETAARLLQGTQTTGDAVDEIMFNPVLDFFATARIYQMVPAPARQGDRMPTQSAGWIRTSITERHEAGSGIVAEEESLSARLRRRVTEELRAMRMGTEYVVVPHA